MGLTRRSFLALSVLVPAVLPGAALAAPPLSQRTLTPRPLGFWSLADRTIEAPYGGTKTVELVFRSEIDVQAAQMRWWVPRWCRTSPRQRTCAATPGPAIGALVAGLQSPIALVINVPTFAAVPKPPNVSRGVHLPACATLTATHPVETCRRAFQVVVEMRDPETRRRAQFTFLIWALDRGIVPAA